MATTKFVAAMSSRIAKTMVDAYRFRNQGANATAKNPARNAFGIKNHFPTNGSHQTINGKKMRYANKNEKALFRVFSNAIRLKSANPKIARSTATRPSWTFQLIRLIGIAAELGKIEPNALRPAVKMRSGSHLPHIGRWPLSP